MEKILVTDGDYERNRFERRLNLIETKLGVVFNTRILLPCLIYGCEPWALSKQHRDMLEYYQRAMEWSMLGRLLRKETHKS